MKITVKELRVLIREEFMRGIPEFATQEATTRFIDDVKALVKRYIETAKPSEFAQQREIYDSAHEMLSELEDEVNDLVQDRMYAFSRRI